MELNAGGSAEYPYCAVGFSDAADDDFLCWQRSGSFLVYAANGPARAECVHFADWHAESLPLGRMWL